MQEYVARIYAEHEDDFDMFGFEPEELDDEKRDSYVYAWYVNNDSKKYFYIGKGKRDRYKHILKEIETFENNPRKYKGEKYKWLKDNFDIESEFLYSDLTEREATILEAYSILEFMKKKQPLLNVILPCAVMEDEEISEYRDKYFYERNKEKFIEYYL